MAKKLALLGSTIASLLTPVKAFAADTIKIIPPSKGYASLESFITNFINLTFAIAVLAVLVMLIWGAFEWIISGGDKDAVGKARGRIVNALIGLAVLAVAFAQAKVAGQFTGINILQLSIPTPTSP